MAGPILRIVAQAVLVVVATLTRVLPQAYQQALQNARRDGVKVGVNAMGAYKMSADEALRILNLKKTELNNKAIQDQFKRYFEANDPNKGGSFYLQSKFYRAKVRLEHEVKQQDKVS